MKSILIKGHNLKDNALFYIFVLLFSIFQPNWLKRVEEVSRNRASENSKGFVTLSKLMEHNVETISTGSEVIFFHAQLS